MSKLHKVLVAAFVLVFLVWCDQTYKQHKMAQKYKEIIMTAKQ